MTEFFQQCVKISRELMQVSEIKISWWRGNSKSK